MLSALVPLVVVVNLRSTNGQRDIYNCNETQPYGLKWKFHCFDGENCLVSAIQLCQTHMNPKCPDGSDHSEYLCQRVSFMSLRFE